jgi:hypothetical protein
MKISIDKYQSNQPTRYGTRYKDAKIFNFIQIYLCNSFLFLRNKSTVSSIIIVFLIWSRVILCKTLCYKKLVCASDTYHQI